MQEWMAELKHVLQYIASQLPSSCTIEVDDEDRTETSTLVKATLIKNNLKWLKKQMEALSVTSFNIGGNLKSAEDEDKEDSASDGEQNWAKCRKLGGKDVLARLEGAYTSLPSRLAP
ncbi:hypothetical protein P7C71_g3071, partial [Lecanoromycetidae sp. Uapishka_2]